MSFADAAPRIINHMNEDHADALQLYVRAFSDAAPKGNVRMTAIDAEGMTLRLSSSEAPVRIPFDPPLQSANEARTRLVQMVQEARATLDERDASPS
jgi:putative heme iron utilization protein